jgi:hypothetical protein
MESSAVPEAVIPGEEDHHHQRESNPMLTGRGWKGCVLRAAVHRRPPHFSDWSRLTPIVTSGIMIVAV